MDPNLGKGKQLVHTSYSAQSPSRRRSPSVSRNPKKVLGGPCMSPPFTVLAGAGRGKYGAGVLHRKGEKIRTITKLTELFDCMGRSRSQHARPGPVQAHLREYDVTNRLFTRFSRTRWLAFLHDSSHALFFLPCGGETRHRPIRMGRGRLLNPIFPCVSWHAVISRAFPSVPLQVER